MATNFIKSSAMSSLRREPGVLADASSMNSSVGTRMLGISSSIRHENKCGRKMIAELRKQEASPTGRTHEDALRVTSCPSWLKLFCKQGRNPCYARHFAHKSQQV